MYFDWNNLICSLLSGMIPGLFIGTVIFLYQRRITKKDEEAQKYIKRRTDLEDEFYHYIRNSKDGLVRLLIAWEYNEGYDAIKEFITKFRENIQQADNLYEVEPDVLEKYHRLLDKLKCEFKKMSDNYTLYISNKMKSKEWSKEINIVYKSISELYYNGSITN